ncbi:unnamed protein product [Onchocerca flexuosa]|uniref:TPM_phosphatase domain-containing protein n=1 Tax=Onchocerca flexuosa TaxID=387005 RepID=A0A183HB39_9BILA|nr:unnamed protein product [Onchocerca flexuosa]
MMNDEIHHTSFLRIFTSYSQLTEQERYRLNNDLLQLSRRTSGDRGVDFCTTKGVDATLFITKQGNEQLARQLNNIWAVDGQCKKSLVFVLSTNDHRLYYSVDKHTPISTQSFQAIIDKNQQLLNEDKFTMALTAIFTELGEAIQDNREEKIKPDYEHKIQNSVGTPQISVLTYFMIVPLIVLHLFAK